MFETSTGAQSEGEGGAVVEGTPAPLASSAPAANDTASDKRAKAAKRQRKARLVKRLKREQRTDRELAKLQAKPGDDHAASSSDQAATSDAREGWPPEEAQAACMPAAVMMLTGARNALGATRYGVALDSRVERIAGEDGQPKEFTVDPIGQQLAPPLAAYLAQGGGRVTPMQALAMAAAFTLGPVAVGHAIELSVRFFDERKARREREAARIEADAAKRVRVVEPAPAPPKAERAAEVLKFDEPTPKKGAVNA